MSLLGAPAFDALLLQGVAGSFGYLLPGPTAAGNAANRKPVHPEVQTSFSRTNAFDMFGDVSAKLSPQFEIGTGLRWTHDDNTSGVSAQIQNGRSILGGFLGALTQSEPTRTALINGLASPFAPVLPAKVLPLFGLTFQAPPGNARVDQKFSDNGFTWRGSAR